MSKENNEINAPVKPMATYTIGSSPGYVLGKNTIDKL
jgi:hypothetical protein